MDKTYEAFRKTQTLLIFLMNLLTLSTEEIADLYTEADLLSFSAAVRRRTDRILSMIYGCFPGGQAEYLNTPEEEMGSYVQSLMDLQDKWDLVLIHIVGALMVVRRRRHEECMRIMHL